MKLPFTVSVLLARGWSNGLYHIGGLMRNAKHGWGEYSSPISRPSNDVPYHHVCEAGGAVVSLAQLFAWCAFAARRELEQAFPTPRIVWSLLEAEYIDTTIQRYNIHVHVQVTITHAIITCPAIVV